MDMVKECIAACHQTGHLQATCGARASIVAQQFQLSEASLRSKYCLPQGVVPDRLLPTSGAYSLATAQEQAKKNLGTLPRKCTSLIVLLSWI